MGHRVGRIVAIFAVLGLIVQSAVTAEEEEDSTWWPFSEATDSKDDKNDTADELKELGSMSRLDRLRQIVAAAEEASDEAERRCHFGLDRVSYVEREVSSLKEVLMAASHRTRRLSGRMDRLREQLDGLNDANNTISEAVNRINTVRDNAMQVGREICNHTEQVVHAKSYEGRQAHIDEALELMRQLRRDRGDARDALAEVSEVLESTEKAWQEIQDLSTSIDTFAARLGEMDPSPRSLRGTLEQLESDIQEVKSSADEVERYRAAGEKLVNEARDFLKEEQADHYLREMQGLYAQLVVERDTAADCPEVLGSRYQEAQANFDTFSENLDQIVSEVGQLWQAVSGEGNYANARKAAAEANSQFSLATVSMDSIEDRVRDAVLCLDIADRENGIPIYIAVPDVRGEKAEVAIAQIQEMNLNPRSKPGRIAPQPELIDTVEAQSPPPGMRLEVGESVYLRIYQEESGQESLPELSGLSVEEAKKLIDKRKLKTIIAAGVPAPSPDMAYRVEKQNPQAGTPTQEVDSVMLRVFGPFQEKKMAPDVIGMSVREARKALAAEGWRVRVVAGGPARYPDEVHTIAAQEPPQGDKVTLTIFGPPADEDNASSKGGDLLLVCFNYFPTIDFQTLPEGMKAKDYVVGLSTEQVQFGPTKDPLFIQITGDARRLYPQKDFPSGQRFAIPFSMKLANKEEENKTLYFKGTLLLEVLEIYSDMDKLKAAHPDKFKEGEESQQFLKIEDDAGLFAINQTQGNLEIEVKGGPITQDWTDTDKQRNLEFYKAVISEFDCFIATALYKNLNAIELPTLRRFRDQVMMASESGRELVKAYYRLGPHWSLTMKEAPNLEAKLRPFVNTVVAILEKLDLDDPYTQTLLQLVLDGAYNMLGPWLQQQNPDHALDVRALPEGVSP